ncbi:MAG: peptidase T [Oscillospiraceae bacterium]|nr:peptidase T [Oscillospiraceae bacterium]
MSVKDLFLKYVQIHSVSRMGAESNPSNELEWDIAKVVAEDMRAVGLKNVTLADNCYVYGWLDATPGYEDAPAIGFIAHMDTATDFCGENVKPRVIENYDGSDVELGAGRSLTAKVFPHLPSLAGKTLIVTDGTTLLGADDKAGIAEILTAVSEIIAEGIPHGRLCIGFTPDEEVGLGAAGFDLPLFGAKYAYTVDGGPINSVDYECFNAASASVSFKGFNVHPGSAKNTMINAALLAMEFNAMLPAGSIPAHTEGYQGFFHLLSVEGNTEAARLEYIVRDHDAHLFEARQKQLQHITQLMNDKYGGGTVTLELAQSYRNMAELVAPAFHLVENAKKAIAEAGLEPVSTPIRGGTDGATLSYMGLPCPNLGTGGWAAHGPYEHCTVEDMETMVGIIKGITALYAQHRD